MENIEDKGKGNDKSFSIYRGRLPHWRLHGAFYFVTWRLYKTQNELTPDERTSVVSVLRHFDRKRYELLAYVEMNEHVLVRPLGEFPLQDIIHS